VTWPISVEKASCVDAEVDSLREVVGESGACVTAMTAIQEHWNVKL
jgi:hypothetical protein